ncbi:MAG: gliding motility protein GldN [Bacteroidota bacterium]
MKVFAILIIVGVMIFGSLSVNAQEIEDDGYNPNSVHPIHENDIMYKKRVWRRMDLREKQNQPFFAFNNEVTKIMIEAVMKGDLYAYQSDSLSNRYTKEQFEEQLTIPELGGGLSDEEKALGFSEDDGWGDSGWGDEGDSDAEEQEVISDLFLPNQVNVLEIMEDIIFDKKRSRLYYDIQTIKLVLPPELFDTGLEKVVATFRYKDLEELFRKTPHAYWFNPQNSREHKNLSDAFALRLFKANLVKVENPEDSYIVDIYNKSPKQGIMASQWLENEIIEYEHNLWEF